MRSSPPRLIHAGAGDEEDRGAGGELELRGETVKASGRLARSLHHSTGHRSPLSLSTPQPDPGSPPPSQQDLARPKDPAHPPPSHRVARLAPPSTPHRLISFSSLRESDAVCRLQVARSSVVIAALNGSPHSLSQHTLATCLVLPPRRPVASPDSTVPTERQGEAGGGGRETEAAHACRRAKTDASK